MQKTIAILIRILIVLIVAGIVAVSIWGIGGSLVLPSFLLAGLICAGFFFSFEHKRPSLRDIMPIVVMCAVASAGRVVFQFLPNIQPVTAIVIIMGVCFGRQTGFVTGALCALISNMFMGQGPWTPWQMLAWGTIGYLAAIVATLPFGKNPWFLMGFGFVAGFLYSVIVDINTVFFVGESISVSLIVAVYAASLPFTLLHAVGNVVFLGVLYRPIQKKLERIRTKYGLMRL